MLCANKLLFMQKAQDLWPSQKIPGEIISMGCFTYRCHTHAGVNSVFNIHWKYVKSFTVCMISNLLLRREERFFTYDKTIATSRTPIFGMLG